MGASTGMGSALGSALHDDPGMVVMYAGFAASDASRCLFAGFATDLGPACLQGSAIACALLACVASTVLNKLC